jgi:hypothetical protein
LRARWQHAPHFHDGSAATLADVAARHNRVRTLGLTAEQQRDLVEYLESSDQEDAVMACIGGINYEGQYFIVPVPAGWTPYLPLPANGPDDLWFDGIDNFKAKLAGPRFHRPVRRQCPHKARSVQSAANERERASAALILSGADSWLSTNRKRLTALARRSLNGVAPVIFATAPGALPGAPVIRHAGGVTFEGRYFIAPLAESWLTTDPLPAVGPDDRWFDREREFLAALNGPWSRTRVRRQPFRGPVTAGAGRGAQASEHASHDQRGVVAAEGQ